MTPLGGGAYAVSLDAGWNVGERPNGGYLLATLARAALTELGADSPHPHVLAATTTFARGPVSGPAEIGVRVLRRGRLASQALAVLCQGGAECVQSQLTLGRLAPARPPVWAASPAPELPPWDECPRTPRSRRVPMPVWDAVDVRCDPATMGWARRDPSGVPEIRGWVAVGEDPLWLLLALDILPVVTLELGSRGWAPTLALTAYLRALPARGRVRARQRALLVQGGLVDETCELWDTEGRLVAHGSQLAASPL